METNSGPAITKWESDKGLPDIENIKQLFVTVTDAFIESRQLAEKITDKKFAIGNFSFMDCGIISFTNPDSISV